MSDKPDFDEICEDINEAASLCCDEAGEYWALLASLHPRIMDMASDAFRLAWEKEVLEQHKYIKEECVIVEDTYTVERKTRELRMKWEVGSE